MRIYAYALTSALAPAVVVVVVVLDDVDDDDVHDG